MKKWKKILVGIILVCTVIYGVLSVNINMNRQIYSSLVNEYTANDNEKNKWNLDNMVKAFNDNSKNSVEESENVEKKCIPKFRVLFNSKPFDFRIDTNKYVFYVNKDTVWVKGAMKILNGIKGGFLKLNEIIKSL